jgi:hypothetical protein
MDVCPPFRAGCFGLLMAWYNGSLNVQPAQKKSAGRVDLLMAVYLPYSNRFISADGPQTGNLRDVASEANIDCEVVAFSDFSDRFGSFLSP